MRLVIAALLLGSGVPVLCQSAGPAPASPGKKGQNPPSVFLPQKEFSKGPPVWRITPGEPLKMVVPPGTGSLHKLGPQLVPPPVDPGMIVRPPASSVGVQPPGSQIAQNLYPGLELLPIQQFKGEPIPTTFPNMKVEQIPITWPQYKVVYAQDSKGTKPVK